MRKWLRRTNNKKCSRDDSEHVAERGESSNEMIAGGNQTAANAKRVEDSVSKRNGSFDALRLLRMTL